MNAALRVYAPQAQQQAINKGQFEDSDSGPARKSEECSPDSFGFQISV
jgi:hypothetical protein